MAWKTAKFKLTSDCPMLMHNGQTADPLNEFAKAMKQISSKRKKTDADHEEMARIEFLAGLYVGPDGPIIPAANVDSMMIAAAKKHKEGPLAKSGAFCVKDARLEYDGPRAPDELWKDERFRHRALVRVTTSRVARTRPVFNEWSAVVEVNYEDSVVNFGRVEEWFWTAGTQIGLGDWRPQHGRFSVEHLPD